jgi:uncharacterized protein
MTSIWIWSTAVPVALALALYAGLCLLVAHRMTTPRRVAPLEDPAWRRLPALRRVAFPARRGRLPLVASFLPTPAARTAVLFVHGKDCGRGCEVRVSTEPLVRALHAAGVAVLLLDLRGHGESGRSRMTYGVRETEDVLGAIDWLRAQGFCEHRIGVFAASMGGAGVLRAALRDASIGPLVLDSTYADFAAMIDRQFSALTGLPRLFQPGALVAARWLTGTDLRQVRPVDDAARLETRPMLVIHAGGDPFVPVADAQRLAAAAGAELWVTPGRHHLASFRDAPAGYVERVTAFFACHLPAPAAAAA